MQISGRITTAHRLLNWQIQTQRHGNQCCVGNQLIGCICTCTPHLLQRYLILLGPRNPAVYRHPDQLTDSVPSPVSRFVIKVTFLQLSPFATDRGQLSRTAQLRTGWILQRGFSLNKGWDKVVQRNRFLCDKNLLRWVFTNRARRQIWA